MARKEWDPETLLDVFGDSLARGILVAASDRPMSANDLADRFDASLPTIYRRANELGKYDLLSEETQIDEDGNHYKRFETTLKQLTLTVDEGGMDLNLRLERSPVDQFEEFWTELEAANDGPDVGVDDEPDRRPGGHGHPHG